MSAFDLAAPVSIGSAPRVVVRAFQGLLSPPGSETLTVYYQLTDGSNNALSRDEVAVEPIPAALLTAIQNHLAAMIQAKTGQVATLNAGAGV